MINNVLLIGAGNVATQLGNALCKKGINIRQVYSFTSGNAEILADKLDAYAIDDLAQIQDGADLYIIAVKDAYLKSVIENMPMVKGIVVHTAGSMNMDLLSRFNKYGILYPFQTFSKDVDIDFREIPFLIEASDKDVEVDLKKLAGVVSQTAMVCDSDQRKIVHLAAVFACNFTNHLYSIADSILAKSEISFDVIKPLLKETANKVMHSKPSIVQTGPAVRGDHNIIETHEKMLKSDYELQKLYHIFTKRISESCEDRE